jgi:hypothetical protein
MKLFFFRSFVRTQKRSTDSTLFDRVGVMKQEQESSICKYKQDEQDDWVWATAIYMVMMDRHRKKLPKTIPGILCYLFK